MENEKEGNCNDLLITSMEDKKDWYEQAARLLPARFKNLVDLRFSKKLNIATQFRGVGYKEVPAREYKFCVH